ncbi:MFS transporter [Thermogemmatispora sp.]|uniref:MFS transporter n=1 Tax=Thermogemmatispora sp. TaxID=1968838 RepID=UPI0035E3F7FB
MDCLTTTTNQAGLGHAGSSGAEAPQHPDAAFVLLGAVQFVLILAITVIAVPLPAIQRELELSSAELALVSAAYGLSFSGLLLFGGRLADLLGRRCVFRLGVAVFGLASAGAGLAPGVEVLLAARFAQGAGAALVAPAAMALLGVVFPDAARRTRAVAVWGGLSSAGATAGTLLSGVVATWVSWRWAFLIPVLVSVVAWLAAPRLLPAGPPPTRARLDILGALLATAGLSGLSYGLVTTLDHPWSSAAVLIPLVSSAALLAVFVMVEAHTPAPLLPLSFLAAPRRATALLAVLLTSAGAATSFFFLALYFQQIRGFSPLWTSAAFLPYGLVLVVGLVAGRLVARFGAGVITPLGLVLAAAGLLLLGRMGVDTPYVGPLLAGLLVFPIGAGLSLAGATVAAVEDAPEGQAGLAGGVVNSAMETGPTLGLALLVALAGARASQLASTGLDAPAATTGGYAFALSVAAVAFALVAGLVAIALHAGRERSGTDHFYLTGPASEATDCDSLRTGGGS